MGCDTVNGCPEFIFVCPQHFGALLRRQLIKQGKFRPRQTRRQTKNYITARHIQVTGQRNQVDQCPVGIDTVDVLFLYQPPHCIAAGLVVAYSRAASIIFSLGTQVILAARSGVNSSSRSTNFSKTGGVILYEVVIVKIFLHYYMASWPVPGPNQWRGGSVERDLPYQPVSSGADRSQ